VPRKTSRKTNRDLVPAADASGSILFASALHSESKRHKAGGRNQSSNRQVAPPEFLSRFSSRPQAGLLGRMFAWFRTRMATANTKELRLAETVQLGEKRFVAIIHVEGRKFLIGGGTAGVNLLTQLDEPAA